MSKAGTFNKKTMKKLLISSLLVLTFQGVYSQGTVGEEFRKLVLASANDFSGVIGDKIMEDSTYIYYNSNTSLKSAAYYLIGFQEDSERFVYLSSYNLETDDIAVLTEVVNGVVGEINTMVSMGIMKGEDYTEGNNSITEMTTQGGDLVCRFITNTVDKQINLYVYNGWGVK